MFAVVLYDGVELFVLWLVEKSYCYTFLYNGRLNLFVSKSDSIHENMKRQRTIPLDETDHFSA